MTRATALPGRILLAAAALILAGCLPSSSGPSQKVLDMEQEAFDLVNDERTAAGLPALVMEGALREVARAHSEDMVDREFFAHVNPDGLDPFQRMDAAGILYVSAGENIAWNNFASPAEQAVAGWMASPPHRANILRPQFNQTGMGVATDGAGGWYFTQDFIGTEAKDGGEAVFDYGEPLAAAE